ncbi:MAG: hypothetical protein MZU91_05600 [Desulfosudis oleivorans]|nr:hypothetical protein [Desulfosudis oleivorans]
MPEKAVCINLMMGLESLSAQSLATVNKSINKVDDYYYMVNKLRRHGISLLALLIFGLDYDDETVFEKTAKFVEDAKVDFPCCWILTPCPSASLCIIRWKRKAELLIKTGLIMIAPMLFSNLS